MKNKSILLVLLLAGVLCGVSSCSDMLTPDLERYTEKNADDTIYSYLGILKSVQNIAERTVILGETRGDLVTTTEYTSDSISQLFNFEDQIDGESALLQAADYYNVINQCNFYLQNCDSGAVKDQYKYMLKEWVQVQALRAWTYMQLVNNYGSVPFVTKPISSSTEGISLSKNATRATKDNLADLLSDAGLYRAYELQYLTSGSKGYPSYNTFSNGAVSIPARSCFLSSALVLADLYLMKNDYKKAAAMYYTFIKEEAPILSSASMTFSENISDAGTYYAPGTGGWQNMFTSYSTGAGSGSGYELVSLIPGAASSANGTVLTEIAHVYGFYTSTRQSGTSGGSTSLSPDEEYQQLTASTNYLELNGDQIYCNYRSSSGEEVQEFYEGAGDARLYGSAPLYRIDGVDYRFIAKYCPISGINNNYSSKKSYGYGFSMYYAVRTYRKALVYLRYAEAINRAGFPEHAFSILKEGIAADNYPLLRYHDVTTTTYDYNIDTATGDTLSIDTIVNVEENVPYLVEPEAEAGGAYYISIDEMERAATQASEFDVNNFLDFSQSEFNTTATNVKGIHGRGCGETRGYRDTLYTYDLSVAQKIAAKRAQSEGQTEEWEQTLVDSLKNVTIAQAVADGTITEDEVIDAVEDLIIDECALETAFEGNRYYDLLRFANHKGNGTIDNEWLAKKIAARGYAPGTGYDAALYGRLVGGTRWYLSLPEE